MGLELLGALLTLVSAPVKPQGMPELKRAVEIRTGGVEFSDKVKRYAAQKAKANLPAANVVIGAVSLAATKRIRIRHGALNVEAKRGKVIFSVAFSW